jgi:NAD(P)-dependent dehydrogenase (short-subunit alcohol dehydrogenase family)
MPAIVHAALEVAVAAALADPAAASDPGAGDDGDLVPVPTAMFRVKSFGPGAGPWSASARALPGAPGNPTTVDVRVSDAGGRPVFEAMGCKIAWRARSAVAGGLSPAERDLIYQVDWRPVQAAGLRVSPGGVWLVLADRTERAVADALVAAMLEAGLTAFAATDASLPYKELTGVVDLRALAAGPEVLRDGLAVMHALLARTGARPRLWLVTRGAQAPGTPSGPRAAQAGLWGLGRALGCEYPEAWGGLIDLAAQPAAPRDEARLVLAALADHQLGADREAAIQGGVLAVPRLERAPAPPAEPVALRASATYLVTGGLGTLGLAWTRWLVRRGARHVVLAGRHAPGAAAREALAALASTGARVRVVQVDASSPADVTALWRRLDDGPPVAGILHAAGLTEDAALGATAWDSVARVLAPKLQGAANLAAAAAARPHPLDFFVGFSSIAALLGNRGQAGYAAANAALDAHIAELRARGVAAWSIAWGPFAANTRPEVLAAAQRRGIAALDIDAALAVFERLLAGPPGHSVVMAVDRARSEPPAGVANPALFAGWTGWSAAPPPAAAAAEPDAQDRAGDLLAQLAGATADRRLALLTDAVNTTTRGVLALDPAFELSPEQRLDQLGLDSLLAIDLVHALGEALGTTLPTTLVLDHPSVAAIARYLAKELAR